MFEKVTKKCFVFVLMPKFKLIFDRNTTQLAFTCSELATEKLEQGVK